MIITYGEVKEFAEHAGLDDSDTLAVIATRMGFQDIESMMVAKQEDGSNTLVLSTYDWREE